MKFATACKAATPAKGRDQGRAEPIHRFLLVSTWILLAALACGREPAKKAQASVPVAPKRCPTGYSLDPPRSGLEPGIRAFREQDYPAAQAVFAKLTQRHAWCATCLVWWGDALLFDRAREPAAAARAAWPHYERAGALHTEGCALPRRPRYYQLMGQAYVALRLAKQERGYDRVWLSRARDALAIAAAEFPASAEVPYNQGRVFCALAQKELQGSPADPGPAGARGSDVEQCTNFFESALQISLRQERPRFLRTHRSTEDWIVRSRTQSEFGPLRAGPRYEEIVQLAKAAAPQWLQTSTPGD